MVEISQKQNLPFGQSITISDKTARKTSLSLKNIEKNIWRICQDFTAFKFRTSPLTCPDFARPQIPNPVFFQTVSLLERELKKISKLFFIKK